MSQKSSLPQVIQFVSEALMPDSLFPQADWLIHLAAASWVLAFLLFAVVYAPLFVRSRARA